MSGSVEKRRIHSSGSGGTAGCGGPTLSSKGAAASFTGHGPKYPPKPMRNVSRSRTVIGRLAGTVSSTGPSMRRTTRRSASSGRSRSTGSSRRTTHSSSRIIVATAVIGLVIDEMRKIVSRRTAAPPSTAVAPITSTCASPRRLTTATSPGTSPRSTYPTMMSWRRARPSVESPGPVIAGEVVERSPTVEGDARGLAVPGRRSDPFVPQLVLEHPADRVAGKVVAELDVARDREVRDVVDTPRAELFLGDVGIRLKHRGDLDVVLAEVARYGVDGDVLDRGVGVERALHLEARDVLAPPSQVVLLAVHEEEEAVLVETAEVARVEPQVAQHGHRLVGTAPVAGEHEVRPGRAGHDLADLTRRNLDVVVVDERHLEVDGVALPRRAGLVRLAGREHRQQGSLGEAVAGAERLAAEPLVPDAIDVRRHRRSRAQPEAVPLLVGVVVGVGEEDRQRAEHRRDRRARPAHLGPEPRHREPPGDAGHAADDESPDDAYRDRVEVEQRQRR